METEKLRQKILTLDKKRQTHQIDNSEYIDTVIQFIAQYTKRARIDEAEAAIGVIKNTGPYAIKTLQGRIDSLEAELSKQGENK